MVTDKTPVCILEIKVSEECENPLSAFIDINFPDNIGWVFEQSVDSDVSVCKLFLQNYPNPEDLHSKLEIFFLNLKEFGINTGPAVFSVTEYNEQDWIETWKSKFTTFIVGDRLIVKPVWENYEPGDNQVMIEYEPGMAFGTGNHPTTKSCLEVLVRFAGKYNSVIDIGCGSGILSVAAVKLGAKQVKAFDFDPLAVKHAVDMAVKNKVNDQITINQLNITDFTPEKTYDLVLANLFAELLIEHACKICSCVKPGGLIAITGILFSKADNVRKTYLDLGMNIINSFSEKEWFCFLLSK